MNGGAPRSVRGQDLHQQQARRARRSGDLLISYSKNLLISGLLLAGAAVAIHGVLASAVEQSAAPGKLYLTAAASSLVEQGLASAAPAGPDAASYQEIPSPGVRYLPNVARATNIPWIDSNGWRFARGMRKVSYTNVPAGSASLAAAEAFVFNVDAIINPDPKDLVDLGRMLRFLKANEQAPLPEMVNIGVVDSPSPLLNEVLNLLTRRNLLYKVVPAPDRTLDLNVQLGTPDFPAEAAANPYEFAARVRAKLGDDKRLVRLYGTSTVIAGSPATRSARGSICSRSVAGASKTAARRPGPPAGVLCPLGWRPSGYECRGVTNPRSLPHTAPVPKRRSVTCVIRAQPRSSGSPTSISARLSISKG